MSEEFDCSPGSQIGSADSDHKKYIRIISDLLCRLFNAVELFFVIIHRKIDPSEEIISCACSGKKFFLCLRSKPAHKIGRASCRERVYMAGVAGVVKKKRKMKQHKNRRVI